MNTKKTSKKTKKEGSEQKQVKLNASQKLAVLENMVLAYDNKFNQLADEIDSLRNSITGLSKRLSASIRATETVDSVNKIVLDENIKELEGKVQFLIQQGILKLSNETTIVDKTFVVGREIDDQSNVINPRIQFAVGSLDQELKDKLIGHKFGDVIKVTEDGLALEVTEVYEIIDPTIKKDFEANNAAINETPENTTEEKA